MEETGGVVAMVLSKEWLPIILIGAVMIVITVAVVTKWICDRQPTAVAAPVDWKELRIEYQKNVERVVQEEVKRLEKLIAQNIKQTNVSFDMKSYVLAGDVEAVEVLKRLRKAYRVT